MSPSFLITILLGLTNENGVREKEGIVRKCGVPDDIPQNVATSG
jgi:hypothetical protein